MAKLIRYRHVRRHSKKELHSAAIGTGASGAHSSPVFTEFSVRLSENAQGESYSLSLSRAEAEDIVKQLGGYLERDLRRVNGSH